MVNLDPASADEPAVRSSGLRGNAVHQPGLLCSRCHDFGGCTIELGVHTNIHHILALFYMHGKQGNKSAGTSNNWVLKSQYW